MKPGTIFFSYSRKDAESFAFKLASDLRAIGANVWIDQLDIPPGRNWDEEIEKALAASKYILFIASEKSVTSQNVLNEIYYAVDENKTVVPIKIHNCTIPFRIRRFQYIDFTGNYDAAFDRLVKYLEANNEDFVAEAIGPVKPEIIEEMKPGDQHQSPKSREDWPETFGKEEPPVDLQKHDASRPSQNKKPIKTYILLAGIVVIAALGFFLYSVFSGEKEANNLSNAASSNDSVSGTLDSNQHQSPDTSFVAKTDTNRTAGGEVRPDRDKTSSLEALPSRSDAASATDNAEVDAHYPGGRVAWLNYIDRTLTYPKEARDEKIEGTVMVRFLIDASGNVSDVTAVGGPVGGGLRKEAIRIIQASGKWVPAVRNGRKVRIYKKLGISFKL